MAKVLVVDDQAPNRELICTLLGYAGHATIEAADGLEALGRVRAEAPALVVCDILMPTMDGYEFVRQLRNDPRISHTEVVLCTAMFMEKEARSLASSCGVSHVLFKPCEPQEILRTVELALGKRRPEPPMPIEAGDFNREHLRLLADKLVVQTQELRSANQRLSALTELNLQLASEQNPYVLLDKVCRGARDLIGAKYALLGVRHQTGEQAVHYATSGLAPSASGCVANTDFAAGLLGQVMQERTARRFLNPAGTPAAVGLPSGFPPIQCGLIAPIVSLHAVYGWVLLVDKLGTDAFSSDDEQILCIHAAQAGRIFENGSLYAAMKNSAEQLQVEVQERERAAQELRLANETLEQRVEQRTAELREIIEGLESFNRTVSHDLRGSLGSIVGIATLAGDSISAGDNEQAGQYLGLIASRASTAQALVSTLLALARASQVVLHTEAIDTRGLVLDVVQSLRPAGMPWDIRVGDLPHVQADAALLRQVFVNLLSNAMKFASAAEPPSVEIGCLDRAARPILFVRDNGVGFGPSQAGRLFTPFQRLHGARYEGFGLGLSIVKRIVERHGGQIWAEGAPGAGATFYFDVGAPDGHWPAGH